MALEKENKLLSLEARRLLVADVLLESRPKLDITDKEGHSASDFALQNRNKTLVRALELYEKKMPEDESYKPHGLPGGYFYILMEIWALVMYGFILGVKKLFALLAG